VYVLKGHKEITRINDKMADYSKAVIYTIKTGDSLYVGSTINFSNRKYDHKKVIYNENAKEYNRNLYIKIRENDGEWDMKPHKEFPCENKTQLTIEEERCRIELNADLNMQSCNGMDIERRTKWKQQWHKDRYAINKETMLDKKNKWLVLNKEHDKKRNMEYYYQNYDKLTMKTICDCGCEVRKSHLKRHQSSAKHIKLMEAKK